MLNIYEKLLAINGEIFFKTDDDELFHDSVSYFEQSNFSINRITYDLHSENYEDESTIPTEHELMFSKEGKKIKFLSAVLS